MIFIVQVILIAVHIFIKILLLYIDDLLLIHLSNAAPDLLDHTLHGRREGVIVQDVV